MTGEVNNYPLSIPKLFGEVVDNVRTAKLADLQAYDSTIQTINYMYGNMKEIVARLLEYANNEAYHLLMFPIFMLVEDITVNRRNSTYYGKASFSLIIANWTKPEYNSAQREVINFDNILRPMYVNLIYQIFRHPAFPIPSQRQISHTYTDRKYWGVDEGTANVLGHYIDAIEVSFTDLPIDWQYCQTVFGSTV